MKRPVTQHGYIGYTRGCRCDICREGKRLYMQAKRAQAAELRKRSLERYVATGVTHGTLAAYQDASCRCADCSRAKALTRPVRPRKPVEREPVAWKRRGAILVPVYEEAS